MRAHTHAHRLDNGAAHEVGTWQGLTHTWGLILLHFMRAVTHSDSLPQFATFGQYVWDVCGESVLHVSFTHRMRHNLHVKHGSHTWHVERASFTCGTWHTHLWDMTHSHVGHDSFICGTWLIHMWGMTHSHALSHPGSRGIYIYLYTYTCTTRKYLSKICWLHVHIFIHTCSCKYMNCYV